MGRARKVDRKAIIIRDDCCCRRCGVGVEIASLQVHHIVAVVAGGSDDPTNLATLCGLCHQAVPYCEPGQEDRFVAWCNTPAEHFVLSALRQGAADPAGEAKKLTAFLRSLKAGLSSDRGYLPHFMQYLGSQGAALRAKNLDYLQGSETASAPAEQGEALC